MSTFGLVAQFVVNLLRNGGVVGGNIAVFHQTACHIDDPVNRKGLFEEDSHASVLSNMRRINQDPLIVVGSASEHQKVVDPVRN